MTKVGTTNMTLLQAIYFAGAIALGVFMGVVIEYFLDLRIISELQSENHNLRLKLAEARKTRKVEHVQTLEIIDNRTSNPDNLFKPF